MTTRRVFLYQAAVIAAMRAQTKATTVPKPIKAFCIDFNWRHPRPDGWLNDFARPGHWADASPSEHVGWYEEIGANVIQTFAVSCNGYSWYKGGLFPPSPLSNTISCRRSSSWGTARAWSWPVTSARGPIQGGDRITRT